MLVGSIFSMEPRRMAICKSLSSRLSPMCFFSLVVLVITMFLSLEKNDGLLVGSTEIRMSEMRMEMFSFMWLSCVVF